MGTLGTIKTTWITNEIVGAGDFNRVEGNTKYATVDRNYFQVVPSAVSGLALTTTYGIVTGYTSGIVSYTGRVLVGVNLRASVVSGTANAEFAVFMNGVNVQPSLIWRESLGTTPVNVNYTLVVDTLINLNASNTVTLRARVSTGTSNLNLTSQSYIWGYDI